MMDGTGQRTSYSYPVNQDEVDFVNGKERIKKIAKWLWLLCFVLMYFISLAVGFGYLVAWFIGKFIVNKIMDKQIQATLQESRAARQASAANLGLQ